VELEIGTHWYFPDYQIASGKNPDDELHDSAYAGAAWRGFDLAKQSDVKERLDYELEVIKNKGYAKYFLVVGDLLRESRERGILTTIRGSVAGSLTTYVLGITNVDPLEYKLPFERFLNPERPSAPDIDMDYADNRRDEIIEYAKTKYGADKVAQIGTFGTMMARAAVRDVARALGHPYTVGDRLAKMIPMGSQGFAMTIKRAMEIEPELAKLYKSDGESREVLDLAMQIEGRVRHLGVHAAGVVIAPAPLSQFVPVQPDPKTGKLVTQYEMKSVGEDGVGLLKFDFLGIKNLAILADAVKRVKKIRNEVVDIENIPLDDKKTFAILAAGQTMGLFQLNGSGMTSFLKQLKPSSIHDINAMVALYRPGPMESIPQYIERKAQPQLVTYLDPRRKASSLIVRTELLPTRMTL
jgi:DNA polymerase-3 subunit alpha